MRYFCVAALSLALVSAAESPANYRVYGGQDVQSDPLIIETYNRVLAKCIPEAGTPPRGNANTQTLHYNAALRGCLYRHGFIDRGAYAYPTNRLF